MVGRQTWCSFLLQPRHHQYEKKAALSHQFPSICRIYNQMKSLCLIGTRNNVLSNKWVTHSHRLMACGTSCTSNGKNWYLHSKGQHTDLKGSVFYRPAEQKTSGSSSLNQRCTQHISNFKVFKISSINLHEARKGVYLERQSLPLQFPNIHNKSGKCENILNQDRQTPKVLSISLAQRSKSL